MLRFLMVFVLLVAVSYAAMLALVPNAGSASGTGSIEGLDAAHRLSSEAALMLGPARAAQTPRAGF